MKCIGKKLSIVLLICTVTVSLSSCSFKYSKKYDVYDSSLALGITKESTEGFEHKYFFQDNAVPKDTPDIEVKDIKNCYGAAAYNLSKNQMVYGYNSLKKIYPASTTKILTALTAVTYGDLDQNITVSKNAVTQEEQSSLAHLNEGDVISLRELLYGLMLPSGNDAATAIAEGVAGSEAKFAKLMNKVAKSVGATHSHFVTVHGLHNKNHYTTPYDIYLITAKAIQNDTVMQLLSSTTYNAYYRDANGNPVNRTWNSSDLFVTGKYHVTDNYEFVGGKTGTTAEAKYCLVLITKNKAGENIISVVYGSNNKYNLYLLHNEILNAIE